jgi:hypothetical protein
VRVSYRWHDPRFLRHTREQFFSDPVVVPVLDAYRETGRFDELTDGNGKVELLERGPRR